MARFMCVSIPNVFITKHMNKLFVFGMAALMAMACQSGRITTQQENQVTTGDNSRTSVDWAGTYHGQLPCADCEGIATSLTLRDDGSYTLRMQYAGKDDSIFRETGRFTWNNAGSRITLGKDQRQYLVGESQLFHLDEEGQRITGGLAEKYILKKAKESITEKYWKLTEIGGKTVIPGSTQKEAHIILKTADSRMTGTGGCNVLGGTYTLEEPNRIRFSAIIRTQMACPDMDMEEALIQALETADSYHLQQDTLQLFRARMAPLARFFLKEDRFNEAL